MFRDKDYLSALFRLAWPIIFQNLISSSLNMVGVVMIGQLGDGSVAAVGLGNQVFFLLNFILFGISSGSAIFTAQFWGKRDIPSIRRVLGFSLGMALAASLFFTLVAVLFPGAALGLYTNDPAVIALGASYIRLVGLSYITTAVTYSFSAVLRSTGNVRVPTAVSVGALSLNILLNYLLIFGKLGLPAMGVLGAGLATCISRYLECGVLLLVTYRGHYPAAAKIHEMLGASQDLIRKFFVTVLPVVINESAWSLGVSVYNMIYAHISTESIAAINITSTVESLGFVIFIGVSNASSIMVGHQIGANQDKQAYRTARRALILCGVGALLMGLGIILVADPILSLYKISPAASGYARNILLVMGGLFSARVLNMVIILTVMRAGGDTRYSMFLEIGTMWLIGIPCALAGAFLLHLPVYWVYLLAMTDEVTKVIIGLARFASRKWIHNLVQAIEP
jgi:putative MATE family efflux protein